MCGISGYYNPQVNDLLTLSEKIQRMTDAIAHRGPDDEGIWVDASLGISLGHRRLSIQDISPAGHQPMISQDERWVMVYNGDTYNPELRQELMSQGVLFRGHSDTEVMLETISQKGLEAACQHFIGKFAFAVWDRKERALHLVRDRFGIKPLYWSHQNHAFFFSSELKSFHVLEEFDRRLNQNALNCYLRYGYVPTPLSIYEGVQKLEPGHILTYVPHGAPKIRPYWKLTDTVIAGKNNPYSLSYDHAVDELDTLLTDSVQRRLTADVPVGAFLSGGVDSSLITALAQKVSSQPVKTFSIGFDEKGFDEAPYAKAIAQHLQTDHTEFYVSSQNGLDVIPYLPEMYDEPFADSSQIPTFLVSKLAKQDVTVALTGDGGDEIFGGYHRYTWAQTAWKMNQFLPMKDSISFMLKHTPHAVLELATHLIPKTYRPKSIQSKIRTLQKILKAKSLEDIYLRIISQWPEGEGFTLKKSDCPFLSFSQLGTMDAVEQMQIFDMLTYMMDDILVKVDRASMAVPLMTRIPLLDHRVVEWSWTLPPSYRRKNNNGKLILKDLLYRYVPQQLIDRPKMGFGIPLGRWLRCELREWAEDLLQEDSLSEILDPKPVLEAWSQHKMGASHDQKLWAILMLQAWRKKFL